MNPNSGSSRRRRGNPRALQWSDERPGQSQALLADLQRVGGVDGLIASAKADWNRAHRREGDFRFPAREDFPVYTPTGIGPRGDDIANDSSHHEVRSTGLRLNPKPAGQEQEETLHRPNLLPSFAEGFGGVQLNHQGPAPNDHFHQHSIDSRIKLDRQFDKEEKKMSVPNDRRVSKEHSHGHAYVAREGLFSNSKL
ncbi:hypothetical protein T439DRAFT_356849 [Meredithblackwellia eburnea MCA 4105]